MDQNNKSDIREMTLLFVDDEANILSSLKRLFRPFGYRILTAESGAAGLEILALEFVDLVISDMRMPEMTGAQFLEKVHQGWPNTVRILLTGYADIGSTIEAINKGQIYRYISKPWEDNDIAVTVRQALELRELEREKARLLELTRVQNEELKELNSNLEKKVYERTEELRRSMLNLQAAHDNLKKSFMASLRIFSSLIEMRCGGMLARHAKRVGEYMRNLLPMLQLSDELRQDLMFATLLKDLGKMILSDRILAKPLSALSTEELAQFIKHPVHGQATLMSMEQLENAAKIIRHQHELFNRSGYPDGLGGYEIPLGARILAIVSDYDALQSGMLQPKHYNSAEAVAYLVANRNRRYDPEIVDTFVKTLNIQTSKTIDRDLALGTSLLITGMIVSRDIVTKDGFLLLSHGHILNEKNIDLLCGFEKSTGEKLDIYVKATG